MGNPITVDLGELEKPAGLTVSLDELKPVETKAPAFSFTRPQAIPSLQDPTGVKAALASQPTLTERAARVTEPITPLAPPENPRPPSAYWQQEWAARQRDIEKFGQLDQQRQAREQQARERQAEIAKQPFETRLVQSVMEPGTALGTVVRQQTPQEKPPEFESDWFKHRMAEAAAQSKSPWDTLPRSLTEILLRGPMRMKEGQARQIAEPFTQPILDLPTATGHAGEPFLAGAERTLGGFTSPENVGLLGALGGLDAAAQSGVTMLRHAPRVISALFATQMGAGLVHSAREYQALKAAGDEVGAQKVLGSAFVQAPLTLLTAYHATAGRVGAPMKAEELLDTIHATDTAAHISETAATPAREAPGAARGAVSVPLAELQPVRPGRGTLFEVGPEDRSAVTLRRAIADESLPGAVREAARAELEVRDKPPAERPAPKFEAKPPEQRTLEKAEASPYQRQQAQLTVNRIRDLYTREYAQSYLKANLEGTLEPERGNVSPLRAAGIRRSIDDNLVKQARVPVAEKYPADVLEEAQAELRAAHDLASSFERPGRYHVDTSEPGTITGPPRAEREIWYGVSSSRKMVAAQFPWYSEESITPGNLADAVRRGKGADYERIVDRIADHIQAQREEARPILEEYGPQLETLAAQVRDVDPELAQTLTDIRSGRYASLKDLPAFIERKVGDAQRAAQFSSALDELSDAEAGDALPEGAPQGLGPDRAAHEAGGSEEAPRGQLAPLEVSLDELSPLPELQPIHPQEVEDLSRQLGRPVSAEEVPEIRRRLAAEQNIAEGLRGNRRDVAGEIREEHRAGLERGAILPGMETAVSEQREAAGREQGRRLTEEVRRPPASIEGAAGRMERESPLFRGTAASPQAEMFTPRGPERDYSDVGKHLGIEYRGVMGADMDLGDKAVVIYQDPESKASVGVRVGEWSPERVEEKLKEARTRMAGDATLYGGLGFLDPQLIRRVMPESIKNALGENISIGEREAGIVREKTGELARKKEQVFQHYADAMARWEKRPIREGRDFILREQHGERQPNADDQAVADQLQKEFAARRQAVEDLSHGGFDHWREHYFPQMWERPNQVADFVKQRILGGRRPLQGPAGFKKGRVFDDLQEGLDAGFKPITNNPVSMALLKLHEMDRYLMAHQILGQSRSEGLAQFVRFGEKPPAGWTRVNDSMFRVLQHSEEAKGMVLRGEYYMLAEAARILNNYLAPGLRGNPLYDLMRGAGNTLNQAQLGFSAFHAMFSAVNSSISDFALALRKASRFGFPEAAAAAGRAATLAASPIRHIVTGTKLMREYLSPGTYAEYSELADAVAKGGGRIYQDPFYRNASISQFWKAWKEGDWARVGLKAFPAALEKMAQPVMEHLVPRLKLGAFADIARESLDRLPPGAGKAEIRAALDRAWDSVDNRFGQVVYDNLFVNKAVKDLGLIGVRSLGWNLGTVRELGGAGIDVAKAAGRAAIGETPRFTDRMAYTLALPIVAGYIGALVNYAYTGQGPQETKDYFFPRTGRTLPNGEPERISVPTYVKDVFAFSRHPLVTVGHKVHPLISMIADMLQNKDFYGVEIRHADDPLVKQVGQIAGYVAEQASPLSVRNLRQRAQAEGRPGLKGLVREAVSPAGVQSFFGITPAPASVTHTAAEEKALEILDRRRPKGTRTSEEYEHQARRSFLRGEVAAGRMAPRDLAAKVQAGEIRPKEAGDILTQTREAPIVHFTRNLGLDDFLSVWDVASGREQTQLRPLLLSKRHLIANLPASERAAMAARLDAAIAGQKAAGEIIPKRLSEDAIRALKGQRQQ